MDFFTGQSLRKPAPKKIVMPAIVYVRTKSDLDSKELERRMLQRRPQFREVAGLIQRIYGRDEAIGQLSGIYFFEDRSHLAAFRETEMAKTIPSAYAAVEVRAETYEVLYPLYPERGPFTEIGE